jgi:hypothetical protein
MGLLVQLTQYPMALHFKGDRDYIQGPDIFDSVYALLQLDGNVEIRDFDIAFHRLARHALVLAFEDECKNLEPVAVCSYSVNGVRKRAYVVETLKLIDSRKTYSESRITDKLKIDVVRKSCILLENLQFTDIEIWVSMTKALHQSVLGHLVGKWLFVRGRFASYDPRALGVRELSIVANFNNKLTRSFALLDGNKVGEIYFSII